MEVIFLGMHSRDNHLRRCESHCQDAGPRLEVGSGLTDIEMVFASVLLSRTECSNTNSLSASQTGIEPIIGGIQRFALTPTSTLWTRKDDSCKLNNKMADMDICDYVTDI